jgi:WD40 repeat protein
VARGGWVDVGGPCGNPVWGTGNQVACHNDASKGFPSGYPKCVREREQLVSGGSDGRLCWWQLSTGECVQVLPVHQGAVKALKVSPDGQRLASCGEDGAITIWDLERGEHLRTLRHDRPYERLNITGIRGLTQAQKVTLRALGAIEDPAVTSPRQAP